MEVKLLNYTPMPIETIVLIWHNSRTEKQASLEDVPRLYSNDEIKELFLKVYEMNLPILEYVSFQFNFINVPVSFREQLVRHRQGAYWSQTSRTRDLTNFEYYEPSVIFENSEAKQVYEKLMQEIRDTYKKLIELGIHPEHARQVLPQAYQHSISASFTLRSLKHIVASRVCEIAQPDLWKPIIEQIKQQLIEIDELFEVVFYPPCMDIYGNYKSCHLTLENENRLHGIDPFEPCSIWKKYNLEERT